MTTYARVTVVTVIEKMTEDEYKQEYDDKSVDYASEYDEGIIKADPSSFCEAVMDGEFNVHVNIIEIRSMNASFTGLFQRQTTRTLH